MQPAVDTTEASSSAHVSPPEAVASLPNNTLESVPEVTPASQNALDTNNTSTSLADGTSISHDEAAPIKAEDQQPSSKLAGAADATTTSSDQKPKPEGPPLVLLDKVLGVISSASEPAIIAGMGGVALMMNLILGRLGLLLAGVAIGVVLHATIQSKNGFPNGHARFGRKKTKKDKADEEVQEKVTTTGEHEADFSSLPPKIASAMGEFCNSIVKDYINYWYAPLVPDDSAFPATCHQHLTQTFLRFSKHISSKRPADMFLMTVFTMSNTMIVFMRELGLALAENKDLRTGLRSYLSANPDSALALMLHRGQQNRKLSILSHEVIELYAPRDLKACEPVALFLRHILRSVILTTTVEKFSDPEFLNEWIVYLLEQAEESGTGNEGVGAVLQAFDRSVAGAAQGTLPKVATAIAPQPQPQPESKPQSPVQHKENIRPSSRQANGGGGGVFRRGRRDSSAIREFGARRESSALRSNGRRRDSSARRGSVDILSTNQNQSPVDSPPRSPIGDPLVKSISNDSARNSYSDLTMIPTKMNTELNQGALEGTLEQLPAEAPPPPPAVNLLNARITVLDTGPATNQSKVMRSKPTYPLMIQVEPVSSGGWMVLRKYQDFEVLHGTLRKIAAVTGSEKYLMAYEEGLPTWRDRFGDELVALLELYLRIVLSEERLVETEALHRFFEKDDGKRDREKQPAPAETPSPWRSSTSLENMGKGVLGALTKAPQSASEGSKALFGGLKKALTSQSHSPSERDGESFRSPFGFMTPSSHSRGASRNRKSITEDLNVPQVDRISTNPILTSAREEVNMSASPAEMTPSESRGRFHSQFQAQSISGFQARSLTDESKPALPQRRAASVAPSRSSTPALAPNGNGDPMSQSVSSLPAHVGHQNANEEIIYADGPAPAVDFDSMSLPPPPSEIDGMSEVEIADYKPPPHHPLKVHEGITEQETQYVLEVMFSIINELYSLSSAWMIRRSLLNIAKSMMLRPGNANLVGIRTMIQTDVLESNTTHDAVADYVRQLRKNALPTQSELEEWEKTRVIRTAFEKEELRAKARELLAESLPQGLTALLGVSQMKEAVYQLFDALQDKDIARGFWTAILAETMQVVCQ